MSPASPATIRRSTVAEFRERCLNLARDDFAETTSEPGLAFEPQWPIYSNLESGGVLLLLVAEIGDAIVGYSVAFLVPDLRCDRMMLQADAIYVDPPFRGKAGGEPSVRALLTAATEDMGRVLGAAQFITHAKEGSTWERILRREGSVFRVREVIFSKGLGDG